MSFANQTSCNIENIEETSEIYQDKPVPEFIRDASQKFCVLSIIGPTGLNQKHKQLVVRIYGCKQSRAQANRWAAALRDDNPFDVFVMSTAEWGVLPPDVGLIDLPGDNERLEKVMDSYKKEQKEGKAALKARIDKAHEAQKAIKSDVQAASKADSDAEEHDGVQDTIVAENSVVDVDHDDNRCVPEHLQDMTQQFCVVNIVAPTSGSEIAMRILGCRKTKEEACAWSKQVCDNNNYFDVFVLDCNAWAPLPPAVARIQDVFTNDKNLQKIYNQFKDESKAAQDDLEKKLEIAHRKSD